jgi:hypothetical protein
VSIRKEIAVTILLVCFLAFLSSTYRVSATSTTIAVDPPLKIVTSTPFTVNVNVSNIFNFTCWQFTLYYQPSIVSCYNVTEGPFLKTGGPTMFVNQTIDNTHGYVQAYCTLFGANSANGSGIIATVFFNAISWGSTPLHLADIKLGDEKIPPKPIPYLALDGIVQVQVGGVHDMAVMNVTTSKDGCRPMPSICENCTANITATIWNQGAFTESFVVTAYANSTVIGSQNVVNLLSGNQINMTFIWNTTGYGLGNYTLRAYAVPVIGEADIADNNFTITGVIVVTWLGDIDVNGKIDVKDIYATGKAFGTSVEGPNPPGRWYNPNCDFDNNGKVDIKDYYLVCRNYGAH